MSEAPDQEPGRGAVSAWVARARRAALPALLAGLLVLAVLLLAHRYRPFPPDPVLAGLTLWLIIIRAVHRPLGWPGAALFVGLGGAAIFSDRLVLAQFLGPICLTMLGLAAWRAVPWGKALGTFMLTGAAYGCAAGI